MEKQRDFSVPDDFSDVTFVVGQKKLHLCRMFLATMSPMFKNMLTSDFAESKMKEIPLIGPPGVAMKYEEFLELMQVIHPPHRDVNVTNYESLMSLAHFYKIRLVFSMADKFLTLKDKEHRLVPLIKKLVVIDKYDDKLPETKSFVLDEFKKVSTARESMGKPEFATLTDRMKARLLQELVTSNMNLGETKLKSFECKHCSTEEYSRGGRGGRGSRGIGLPYFSYDTRRTIFRDLDYDRSAFSGSRTVHRSSYIEKDRTSAYCTYCGEKNYDL